MAKKCSNLLLLLTTLHNWARIWMTKLMYDYNKNYINIWRPRMSGQNRLILDIISIQDFRFKDQPFVFNFQVYFIIPESCGSYFWVFFNIWVHKQLPSYNDYAFVDISQISTPLKKGSTLEANSSDFPICVFFLTAMKFLCAVREKVSSLLY